MEEQGQREIQLQLLLLPAPAGRRALSDDVPAAPPSATDHPQLDLDLSMSIGSKRHRGDRRRSPMRTGERRRMVHEAGHPCCALLP